MTNEMKVNIILKLLRKYKNSNFVRTIVFGTIFTFFILTCCNSKPKEVSPNIIFILADDLGTEVLGSYGGTTYNTPNIDKLAQSGIRFDHCYSAPVCSPSRVKLLTGRYGFRTGQTWGHIPSKEITFGQILRDKGYKTAIAGKWQLAMLKDSSDHIKQMGFDESCVFGWHEGPRYYEPFIYQNGKVLEEVEDKYGPDIYNQFLIDFISRNKDERFFAYYSMALAHEISNDLNTPPPTAPNGEYQSYKELVEYADKMIGKLLNALDEMGLRDNTLILFSGDNGTPYHFIVKYEDGKYLREPVYSAIGDSLIRGGKSFLTDAGTHVPLIASWKGVSPEGVVNKDLIDFSDFMPTFAELAGAEIPKDRVIDGKSFVKQLKGLKGETRSWAFQEWEGKYWIRNQRWKLYYDGRLYDMNRDGLEKNPIGLETTNEEAIQNRRYLQNELNNLK